MKGAISIARVVGIGIQDFEKIISENLFYIDKTEFIREWWESRDSVTLITRPRRFGKTLNMSMLEPKNPEKDDAIILEFKIHDPDEEKTLEDTVKQALRQIEEKQYSAQLIARGIPENKIRSYGFAFQGKKVQIG